MLSVRGLHSYYGDSHILQGIDLTIADRTRVALVGRNGSGKTTLLKSIMNAGPRVDGLIEWDGRALGAMPGFRRVREGLCLVPEDRRIFTHITVSENLDMAVHGVPRDREVLDSNIVLNRFPMLVPLKDRLGGGLSGGEQQMLAVARAIVTRPRLMLLDEPTEGLAPVIVEQLARDVVAACEEFGAALLLCEQNLWFARRCTNYVHVIESGRLVYHGSWQDFDTDADVKKRYLAV